MASFPPRRIRRPGVAPDRVAAGRRRPAGPPSLRKYNPALEALEGRPLLAAFLFDPDGAGAVAAQLINGLDFLPGDALADNSVGLAVGSTFQLLYQARLGGVIDTSNTTVTPAGLNATYEITAVASVTETVTSVSPTGTVTGFQLAPGQAANSFIQLYFDPIPDANPLTGTGFVDGTLILSSFPGTSVANAGSFALATDAAGAPVVVQYDQSGLNNYPGTSTVQGSGALALGGNVFSQDSAFFQSTLASIAFTATTATPFTQVDPSADYLAGSPAALVPDVGSINGLTAGRGPDFAFQADAGATAGVARVNLTKLTNGTDNNTTPGVFVPVGSTVTFTYVVTNTGEVPLIGVGVRDDNGTPGNVADDFNATFVGGDTNGNGDLDLAETWTFTASRIATPGQYTNIGTARAFTATELSVTATDTDNHFGGTPAINLIKLTNGTDNNAAPGVLVPVGSTVTFTYVVTNTGNIPLPNVAVRDDNGTPGNPADDFNATFIGGDANGNGLLDLAETWTLTASRIATAGQYTNIGTATGFTGSRTPVADTDPDNHFGSSPGINLIKLTNGTDNNAAPGIFVIVGSTVTFTYVVTNAGNVPLSGVTVRDDSGTPANPADDLGATLAGGDANGNGLLDTGETWTFTATRVATPGQHTNLATATGSPPTGGGTAVTDTDLDNHFGSAPSVNIVKLTNGTNSDTAPGIFVPVGSRVTFTYVVTNTGNVPLPGVTVTDDNATPGNPADDLSATLVGGDTNGNGLLDLSETWSFTATRVATPGQHTNVATATVASPGTLTQSAPNTQFATIAQLADEPVLDTDVDNHFGSAPAINVIKRTNGTNNDVAPGVLVPVGGAVTFTYLVTNTGNVPLSAVTVRDDNGTAGNLADDFNAAFVGGDANTNGLLDTGETWTFTASRTAAAGQYTNTATATGTPPQGAGPAVTDTDTDNHFGGAPGINLVKLANGTDNNAAPGPIVAAGSTVTFTYVVTNTGNVPLSGVVVRDDNGTPADPADDFNATLVGGDANGNGLLDLAEAWTFQAASAAGAGQYTNLGTATGTPAAGGGPGVSDSDAENYFGNAGGIGVLVPTGSTVVFTYLVRNTGQAPLSSVSVRDDNGTPGNTFDDFGATFARGDTNGNGLLDTTETWTYTASRVARAGQQSSVATAAGTPPAGSGPRISNTDPENYFGRTVPSTFITSVRRLGVHRQPTRLVVSFSALVDPARAQDPNNYSVVLAGADGRFGTRDDRRPRLNSVTYNPATNTVTLRPAHLINLHALVRLTVRGTSPGGLTDRFGNPLDGDRDGRPGGNFVATFRGFGPAATAARAAVASGPSRAVTQSTNGSVLMNSSLPPSAVDALLGGGSLRLSRRVKKA